jgi:hypothetical protein
MLDKRKLTSAENGKKGGRPKARHTLQAEQARAYVISRVVNDLLPIMDAQIDAAKGLWYEEITKEGKRRIYKAKPDIFAGKNLLDQVIGKAKETVEVQGDIILKLDV